jgi:hypothetical protein
MHGLFIRKKPPNGLELCRAALRARLLFYDLRDGWQVGVPPAAEAASAETVDAIAKVDLEVTLRR